MLRSAQIAALYARNCIRIANRSPNALAASRTCDFSQRWKNKISNQTEISDFFFFFNNKIYFRINSTGKLIDQEDARSVSPSILLISLLGSRCWMLRMLMSRRRYIVPRFSPTQIVSSTYARRASLAKRTERTRANSPRSPNVRCNVRASTIGYRYQYNVHAASSTMRLQDDYRSIDTMLRMQAKG